jgi:tRNA(Ile)-lysidine synthase TilS/MesJ
MRCDKCGREPVIHQRYSGLHLCREHFIADFEAKAKRAIRTHGGLARGDRIAVVLTGSGAGCALLQFLSGLTGRRRDIALSAIVIDETPSWSGSLLQVRAFAEAGGVEWFRASFSEELGVRPADRAGDTGNAGSCRNTLMQVLVHRIARRAGITKLAFSTCLEDRAESVLVQVLRGTPGRLFRVPGVPAGQVEHIRPFMYAPFDEVCLYGELTTGLKETERYCPPSDTLAAEARDFIREYSARHPSTPHSLAGFGGALAGAGMPVQDGIRFCDRCGEWYETACAGCRILDGEGCHAR